MAVIGVLGAHAGETGHDASTPFQTGRKIFPPSDPPRPSPCFPAGFSWITIAVAVTSALGVGLAFGTYPALRDAHESHRGDPARLGMIGCDGGSRTADFGHDFALSVGTWCGAE
jgi:hypothetical protein